MFVEIFYSLIYFFSLTCASMFSFMKHPLAMGLILMIQTIMVCLMLGTITKTFWFSYILFLIFLGGMLVLFIYVTSLASNEMFSFSSKILFMNIISLNLFLGISIFIDKNLFMSYFMNLESTSICSMNSFLNENSLMLNKLYNFPINLSTILLMIYLFLVLIAVVKITDIFEGPLRPKC